MSAAEVTVIVRDLLTTAVLLAAPPEEADQILRDQPLDVTISRIGHFVAEPGLWELEPDGALRPLAPKGWRHEEGREA